MIPARIIRQLSSLFGVRFLAIGLTFAQTVVLTRVFGPDAYGALTFAISSCALATLVAACGFDQLLMRRLAALGEDEVRTDLHWRKLLGFSLVFSSSVTALILVIGLTLLVWQDLGGAYRTTLIGACIALPLMIIRKYCEAIVQGSQRVLRSIIGSQLIFPFLVILGGGVVFAMEGSKDTTSITVLYVLAMIGSTLAALVVLGRSWKVLALRVSSTEGDAPRPRTILISGVSLGLVGSGFVLSQNIDFFILGVLGEPSDVALVRVSARVAEAIGMLRAVALLQYKPLLARASGRGETKLFADHIRKLCLVFTLTGTPLFLIAVFFGEEVMGVFGPGFVEGAWIMRVYVLGVFISLLTGASGPVLTMSGHENIVARLLWVSLGINILLDLALIPWVGAIGCGIATVVAQTFFNVSTVVIARRRLGLDPSILMFVPALRPGAPK
ncbi:polysaccharide biosynthesis C-terminal domain-containing protein [Phenylobacterium sp.]|uniref:oligosaccharide flippase family protein n=1 Tax=Phenylobacterium sp. TaxID=1871053 RepID=UPI00272FFEED|nr:polysaccharide biosynthesis C-terminal domain-containing protein [Phenylobacterium sp.]MDP1616620.1 polysaccharide biosynthesis C-terminal domain-containing protein [Phenylobacterium sp.]MDP1986325.1 polysaccharide biosynthesis C-terminal domain-containing protein [Phenylobacterium sp.]